jgi:hypothetical protein
MQGAAVTLNILCVPSRYPGCLRVGSPSYVVHVRRAELCVTQAAVSRQISGPEARLGVALFRGSNRSLILTNKGVAIAPPALFARGLGSGGLVQPFGSRRIWAAAG